MTLSDRIKAPSDVPSCTDCGINKHHTSEQCTQIRIAKAVLDEHFRMCLLCSDPCATCEHGVDLEHRLQIAESLGQQ